MAKRDTTEETLTGLKAAMDAVDNGENPLQSDGNDFVDPVRKSSPDNFYGARLFGAIPATDHDRLDAELSSREAVEKIVKGEPLVSIDPRDATHGPYAVTARISQSLKRVVELELSDREFRGLPAPTDMQRESLDMICTQMARIIAGDSGHFPHWRAIGEYTRIVNGS